MRLLLIVISVILIVELTNGQKDSDYCSLCKNNDHTMCIYKGRNTTTCNVQAAPALTAAQQQQLVDKHNQLRSLVASGKETRGSTSGGQPAAKNMKKMTWNPEIARIAQRWADQCTWGHDKCRSIKKYYVGQNAQWSGSSDLNTPPNLDAAVQGWYDEVDKFDKRNINPFKFTMDTGHYTQVVWADSDQLGCGYSRYKDGQWYKNMLICNYGPGGNMAGAAMYQV